MAPLLLLLLLPLAADAHPGEPDQEHEHAAEASPRAVALDVSKWDVGQYNDYIAQQGVVALRQVYAEVPKGMYTPSPEVMTAMRRQFSEILKERRDVIAALPPWDGDPSLRDAAVAAFDEALVVFDTEVAELYGLLAKTDVRNADLKRAEALFDALEQRSLDIDAKLKSVQEVFAERHGLTLIGGDEPPPPPKLPEFEAEGVPPEGVELAPNVFMNFTVSYTNGVVTHANRIVEAVNGCFAIDPNTDADGLAKAASEAKALALAERSALDAMDQDWQGEDSLMNGARGLASAGVNVATHMEEYAALWQTGRRDANTVGRINELATEMNTQMSGGMSTYTRGEAAWRERWQIDAYNAFVLAQSKAAPEP